MALVQFVSKHSNVKFKFQLFYNNLSIQSQKNVKLVMNIVHSMNHGRIYIFFIENKGKLLCLICKKTILTVKEYNVKRHYETEHKLKFDTLTGDLIQIKINNFKSSLTNQQNSFKLQHKTNQEYELVS